MRRLFAWLMLGLVASPLCSQVLLEAPRFGAADLDGDGTVEVVVGGRTGPYRAGSGVRGELQVGGLYSGGIHVLARADLPVVRDVAIGDYLGDGRPDVFSIGDGWLKLHRFESGRLVEGMSLRLRSDWTDRVAVLTRDSNRLIAVTEYEIGPDSDVGVTTVRGFAERGGSVREVWAFSLRAHVGDLAFLDDGKLAHLVLETGAGDEGGDVQVYEVREHAVPVQVWGARLTDGHRSLSIEATGGREVVLTSLDGLSQVFTLQHSQLILDRPLSSVGRVFVPVEPARLTGPGATAPLQPSRGPGVLIRDASGWSAHPAAY